MKAEDIKTKEDAMDFCEGLVNDFDQGLITRNEILSQLGKYTGRLTELFWVTAKKQILEVTADCEDVKTMRKTIEGC